MLVTGVSQSAEQPVSKSRQTVQNLPAPVAAKTDNLHHQYWLYLPDRYASSSPEAPLPLIIYLHGSSRRGRDIVEVKANGLPPVIDTKADFDFIVASPQALSKYPWQRCWQPNDLILLLDELLKNYHIDPNRVYLTGLSMGGYGTWACIARHPKRFAAAAPICGGGDPAWAKAISPVPVWAFHGEHDYVVPIQRSAEMIDAIQAAGGRATLTRYPKVGHDSFTQTYANPALYAWFLQHTRVDSTE